MAENTINRDIKQYNNKLSQHIEDLQNPRYFLYLYLGLQSPKIAWFKSGNDTGLYVPECAVVLFAVSGIGQSSGIHCSIT